MDDRELRQIVAEVLAETDKAKQDIGKPRRFLAHELVRLGHELAMVTVAGMFAEHILIPTVIHVATVTVA
jgi:hypothetical protein